MSLECVLNLQVPQPAGKKCPQSRLFFFGTFFGIFWILLRPWDWGGVGVDPRFPRIATESVSHYMHVKRFFVALWVDFLVLSYSVSWQCHSQKRAVLMSKGTRIVTAKTWVE
eukprot:4852962-Amphidinium_carterae.1